MGIDTNIWIHAIKAATYTEANSVLELADGSLLKLSASNKTYPLGDAAVIKALTIYGGFEEFVQAHKRVLKINLELSETKLEQYQKLGIKVVNILQDEYPPALRELTNPPAILYYYGDLSITNLSSITGLGIVGTRDASEQGKNSTKILVESCADYQTVIVSGLARGIDSAAHNTALIKQIPTIAVLGSGLLNFLYSGEQKDIFKAIKVNQNSMIISEFEPEQNATHWTFAHRNRIIAALTKITVVIEAPLKSGALITADYAQRLGRQTYALPGNNSPGTNKLIKDGKAKTIIALEMAPKIFDLVKISQNNIPSTKAKLKPLNPISEKILEELKMQESNFDNLLSKLKLDHSVLLTNLSILEIKGLVIKESGAKYSLTKSFSK